MENISPNAQIHGNSLRILLIILILGIPFVFTFSQKLSTSDKKASKLYYKADKAYKERDFESALALLEESVRRDISFFEAYLQMGSLYNALGESDSVYSKFRSYANFAPDPLASVLERLAHMSFDRGDYQEARKYINQFLIKVPEKKLDRKIDLLVRSLDFVESQLKNPIEIEINELPPAINSYQLQYLPTITVDDATMIYTVRQRVDGDENIVVSYKKNGEWQPSESISHKINTPFNEGASTISADGRTMIFTSCDRRDGYGSCDLFITNKVGDVWSRPKNLGKTVNTRYWESQPSLSADGKTLYFSSNRPGGFGGRDIWVTQNVDEVWQSPVNLGEKINSFQDETTPFIHFNGSTLYLSSNSYPGMGGYDLFSSNKLDSVWNVPENLGFPINTFKDEVALLITADGSSGYFAKEKQKGREILDSKIVGFSIPETLQPTSSTYLLGEVVDSQNKTPLRAQIEIHDVESNEKLFSSSSDSVSGQFYMVLPANKQMAGYVKKKGYLYRDFSFSTKGGSILEPDTIYIALDPIQEGKSIVLENIYFEVDSYELDERSKSEINNVIQILRENPNLTIEISGHTDNTGTKSYNQELSKKRAQSVYEAIIERVSDERRISYVGYGDSQPLNSNDTEANKRSNRRIEFRVLRL